MPRASAPRRKTLSFLSVSALLVSLGTGCPEPCRYDADCDATAGLTRCDLETGTCLPLSPLAPMSCTSSSDCEGGRTCAEGACHFAPSCQRVAEGAVFDYIASCSGGVLETGTAEASTNGCRVSLVLGGVLGQDARVTLEPISATQGELAELLTSAGSELSCAPGSWSAGQSGASLPGCTMPGGEVCDVGLLRRGAGPICLAEGDGCDPDETCEPIGGDPRDVGSCR